MDREGFASGLALVIQASRRRINDLSIAALVVPSEINVSAQFLSALWYIGAISRVPSQLYRKVLIADLEE